MHREKWFGFGGVFVFAAMAGVFCASGGAARGVGGDDGILVVSGGATVAPEAAILPPTFGTFDKGGSEPSTSGTGAGRYNAGEGALDVVNGGDDVDGGDGSIATVGPDVIVGDMFDLAQYGRVGGKVGLAMAMTCCNKGDATLHWAPLPDVRHPLMPINMYRLKNDRFEQIGQSWLKHGIGSANHDECGLGCQDPGDHLVLGVHCSDIYNSSFNSSPVQLGSRAWANPFTGVVPANCNDHTGHNHDGVSHRLTVSDADLEPVGNAGALYFAEGQAVSSDEYTDPHHNMFNNVSYRRHNVAGMPGGTWNFAPVGATVQEQPAVFAWSGSTRAEIEPNPGSDGRAYLACKVTSLGGGLYHYEYALYNMNFDRAFGSFKAPMPPAGMHVSNIEFHAPENPPGFANDGTVGNQGYSNAAWISVVNAAGVQWSCTTFAQSQNSNAVRWSTLYNFRFDADVPPMDGQVEVGIFKPGSPTSVQVAAQVPLVAVACDPCDTNCDGSVNQFDIQPFVEAIQTHSQCSACAGDANGDGSVNQFDVQDFVGCLAG